MALDAVKNFAFARLVTGYDESATEIRLVTGAGDRFPDPSADGEFNLVWWNTTDFTSPALDNLVEIVRCVERSGDVLKIIRAQESTIASKKNLPGKDYKIELNVTEKMMKDISSKISNLEETSNFNNELLTYTLLGT